MVKEYKDWKWAKGPDIGGGDFAAIITDAEDNDWYELMHELDGLDGRWVVGIQDNTYASWATDGRVSGKYAPRRGDTVVVVKDIPEAMKESVLYWRWDGSQFFKQEPKKSQPKERTKEDIMADLLKLQEELKAL